MMIKKSLANIHTQEVINFDGSVSELTSLTLAASVIYFS
jgi:hypothetical protein